MESTQFLYAVSRETSLKPGVPEVRTEAKRGRLLTPDIVIRYTGDKELPAQRCRALQGWLHGSQARSDQAIGFFGQAHDNIAVGQPSLDDGFTDALGSRDAEQVLPLHHRAALLQNAADPGFMGVIGSL